jgi:glycosyltransferase involved in cell wall biosynthesis
LTFTFAADLFISLADNIQETFGLTPVEAMAAELPVLVTDWDGYRETVRDGMDGFRIPTWMPPPTFGQDLAVGYALGLLSYDQYVARLIPAERQKTAVLTLMWLAKMGLVRLGTISPMQPGATR